MLVHLFFLVTAILLHLPYEAVNKFPRPPPNLPLHIKLYLIPSPVRPIHLPVPAYAVTCSTRTASGSPPLRIFCVSLRDQARLLQRINLPSQPDVDGGEDGEVGRY